MPGQVDLSKLKEPLEQDSVPDLLSKWVASFFGLRPRSILFLVAGILLWFAVMAVSIVVG
jgi:hypothetical protein